MPSKRAVVRLVVGLPLALVGLLVAVLLSPAVLDPIVFTLTGDCVSPFFVSDGCRGAYSFAVDNEGAEPVDIVITVPGGPEYVALRGVEMYYPVERFSIKGKCDPSLVVIARTSDGGREVGRKVGMCRREVWTIGSLLPTGS